MWPCFCLCPLISITSSTNMPYPQIFAQVHILMNSGLLSSNSCTRHMLHFPVYQLHECPTIHADKDAPSILLQWSTSTLLAPCNIQFPPDMYLMGTWTPLMLSPPIHTFLSSTCSRQSALFKLLHYCCGHISNLQHLHFLCNPCSAFCFYCSEIGGAAASTSPVAAQHVPCSLLFTCNLETGTLPK